jgi:hypothetical protein
MRTSHQVASLDVYWQCSIRPLREHLPQPLAGIRRRTSGGRISSDRFSPAPPTGYGKGRLVSRMLASPSTVKMRSGEWLNRVRNFASESRSASSASLCSVMSSKKPTMRLSSLQRFAAPGSRRRAASAAPARQRDTGRTTVKRRPSARSRLIASTSVRRSSAAKDIEHQRRRGARRASYAHGPAICRNAGPMYSSRVSVGVGRPEDDIDRFRQLPKQLLALVDGLRQLQFGCPVPGDCAPGRS